MAVSISQRIADSLVGEGAVEGFASAIAESGVARTDISLVNRSEAAAELGLPGKLSFEVVFAESTGRGEVAGFDPVEHIIFIYALPFNAKHYARTRPYDVWRHVMRFLDEYSQALIHEVTHMIDHFRGDRFLAKRSVGYKGVPQGTPEFFRLYYNDSSEFNAHFQQGAFSLYARLSDMRDRDRKYVLLTFNRFLAEARKEAAIGSLYTYATPRNKKRLQTRLWQTWELWKDRAWA
jgi:hypothetical protein